MELIRAEAGMAEEIAPLIAGFRVVLRSLKGEVSEPDIDSGREEFLEFLRAGYPVFAAVEEGSAIGYVVCRIEAPCLWVEHLYVRDEHRRRGVASMLFEKAEELAAEMGEDTVFNFVHPNNERIIGFLRSKGYTVLNMIELRKPYRGEKPEGKINVGKNEFDY